MIYMVVLCVVVATLCGVTIYKTRSVHTQSDLLVAGRKLPWPVLVFTLLSSWIGAGSLLGGGENAYRNGFVALWQPAGGWVGLIVIALIAGRARRFAQFTVPDLLETRYNATARVMATIAIVISANVDGSGTAVRGAADGAANGLAGAVSPRKIALTTRIRSLTETELSPLVSQYL